MNYNQNTHLKGLFIVMAGVFVLSFDALIVRLVETSPWNLVFWRGVLIALCIGTGVLIRSMRAPKADQPGKYRGLWQVSLTAGLGLVLFPVALEHTSTANVVVILTLAPLFSAILARIFLHEKLSRATWVAIFTVCIGVAVIFSGSLTSGGIYGDLIALVAAFNFGLNIFLVRGRPHLGRRLITTGAGIVAAAVAFPLATPFALDTTTYVYLFITGAIQMPLALILIYTGTRYLPAAEVSLLILVETILAPIWVWLAVNELPPKQTFWGGGLILSTLFVHSWIALRREKLSKESY